MARPKTSVDRLANLRKTFQANKGKVLTAKQVNDAVGAVYWRACIKDLKAEGMNIESVRDGRTVVGYKFVDIKDAKSAAAPVAAKKVKTAAKPVKATKKKAAKAPAKSEAKAEVAAVAASKPKKAGKPTKSAKAEVKAVTVEVDETPAGEEDPDVLAILQQAGLN